LAVVEEIVVVERLVTVVVIGYAGESLAARLGDDIDDAARGGPVLGGVGALHHLDLGDGVHVDRRFGGAAARGVARYSVDVQRVVVLAGARHGGRAELPESIAAGGVVDHARHHLEQGHDVAAASADFADHLRIDDSGALGAFGLDLGAGGHDLDGVGDRADLHLDLAERQAVARAELDVALFVLLEAVHLHLEAVGSGLDLHENELAGIIGGEGSPVAEDLVRKPQLRAGDSSAARVDHPAADRPGRGLTVRDSRQKWRSDRSLHAKWPTFCCDLSIFIVKNKVFQALFLS
jgi:hypothetical protein